MLVFPVGVVVLNAGFSIEMMRRFFQRGRSYYVAWAAALMLGFLAAAFYLIFLGSSDQTIYFKMYYLCGGLLMAAYLGLGSVYLHMGRRVGDALTLILVLVSIVAAGFLFSTPLEMAKLHDLSKTLGPGTGAIRPGVWKAFAAILNTFGAAAVILGALYSVWRALGRRAPMRFVWANVLIALGTMLAALAGLAADQGAFSGAFWAVLALGFVVLFAGFMLTTSSTSRSSKPIQSSGVQAPSQS